MAEEPPGVLMPAILNHWHHAFVQWEGRGQETEERVELGAPQARGVWSGQVGGRDRKHVGLLR